MCVLCCRSVFLRGSFGRLSHLRLRLRLRSHCCLFGCCRVSVQCVLFRVYFGLLALVCTVPPNRVQCHAWSEPRCPCFPPPPPGPPRAASRCSLALSIVLLIPPPTVAPLCCMPLTHSNTSVGNRHDQACVRAMTPCGAADLCWLGFGGWIATKHSDAGRPSATVHHR